MPWPQKRTRPRPASPSHHQGAAVSSRMPVSSAAMTISAKRRGGIQSMLGPRRSTAKPAIKVTAA